MQVGIGLSCLQIKHNLKAKERGPSILITHLHPLILQSIKLNKFVMDIAKTKILKGIVIFLFHKRKIVVTLLF